MNTSRNSSRSGRALAVLLLAFLPASLVRAEPPVALDNGLVAHFAFENNLFATGTGAAEGKAVGNVGFDQGVIGNALALHGDDCVEIADSPALRSGTLSVCAWVCPRQEHSYGRIAEKGDSNSFWLNLYDNKARFGFYSGRYHELDSGTALKANEWAFVAGTFDGEVLRVFVNGALESVLVVHEAPRHSAQSLLIGFKPEGVRADHFLGWIDELRLYNRALSAAEVRALALAK